MTFDAPLLLLLSPLVALAFAGGAWLARRQRIRLARRWSSSLGRLARNRGGWAPPLSGAERVARGNWVGWASGGPDPGPDRHPRPQPGVRRRYQPFHVGRGRGAEPVTARRAGSPSSDSGSRGRPARAHRLCREELHPGPADGRRRRGAHVSGCAGSGSGQRRWYQPGRSAGSGSGAAGGGDRRGRSSTRGIHRRRSCTIPSPKSWLGPRPSRTPACGW